MFVETANAAPIQKRPLRTTHRTLPPKRIALHDEHQRHAMIGAILRTEIVPRLLLIHHEIRKRVDTAPPSQAEIEEFGRLAMKPDSASATASFVAMREKGHSIDSLFVDFLAPTARHLGELWEQDRVDFIDVTLGIARLQEVLEMFGLAEEVMGDDLRHRAILIAPPGEKHLFGIDMVAKFLRAAGWTVTQEIEHAAEHNVRSVADEWIGVVGLGVDPAAEPAVALQHALLEAAPRRLGRLFVGEVGEQQHVA